MFEKYYYYANIKNKGLEIIYEGNKIIRGLCVSNPKVVRYGYYETLVHSLAIQVDKLPTFFSSSFYITDNYIKPYYGHIIYLPFRIINSIFVLKPDIESKLMLFWIAKNKENIPLDVINNIYKFINKGNIKIPVIDFNQM
tara:strand:- start:838 stop:1257 length:420 start_codon:yes stop_codon:yes gene_type:complete